MRLITSGDLERELLHVRRPEVFPESWERRRGFAQYKEFPRPCHGLFYIKTDIRVDFYPQNDSVVHAARGDVVFIPCGNRYHVTVDRGTPDGIDSYTVNFDLTDEKGEPVCLADRICVLCRDEDGLLDMYFQKLSEATHPGGSRLRLLARFYDLLDAIAAPTPKLSGSYYTIRAGVEALRAAWNRNEPIETYAALCGVSETYFYRCFREWAGKSPVEYRNALRLSNAEAMLRHTDMTVGEIAGVVGFEDPFYFSRSFTKAYGCSPRAYRAARRV